ncbi:hypothetical protein TNCV_3182931 [Trichonephila clavipes]|uniref:Uncharacterized protein n=1 Tax=Trichonephila clavipes TaxID=2585209 RepID=A0A8X6SHC7_TRICX|nr:hypothetical protein TNCV_3182931 [Trichonephila clavipes]
MSRFGGLEVACPLRKLKAAGPIPDGVDRFSGCEEIVQEGYVTCQEPSRTIVDEDRSGRPVLIATKPTEQQVEELVRADRRGRIDRIPMA